MEMNKTGTIIQMGILRTPEYLFTAFPDWQAENNLKEPIWQLPKALEDIEAFKYYGIDYDPHSTAKMIEGKEEHPTVHPNVNWITGFIGEAKEPFKRVYSNRTVYSGIPPNLIVPTYTFDTLIDFLEIDTIDALIMDIEGSEFAVLENYSWRIKPTFISVEVHTFGPHGNTTPERRDRSLKPVLLEKLTEQMIEIITQKGYDPIYSKPTNYKHNRPMTHELKFLRNE